MSFKSQYNVMEDMKDFMAELAQVWGRAVS
jgi:hypothetical protein